VPLAAGIKIDGAKVSQLGRPASTRRGDYQLATFARAETLKEYLVAGMSNRRFSSGGADFSPAPAAGRACVLLGDQHPGAGVDEADVMKSDGQFVYSVTAVTTTGLASKVRIVYVGDGGSALEPVGEFSVYQAQNRPYYSYNMDNGLYLHAGNLVVLTTASTTRLVHHAAGNRRDLRRDPRRRQPGRAQPALARQDLRLAGVQPRIGDRLYLVSRFTPTCPATSPTRITDAQRAATPRPSRRRPSSRCSPHRGER
jgi:hypothetical protein